MKILNDVLVIDLSSVLAGPSVGSFFAELGAEVIKFENAITGGDVTRTWRLPEEPGDRKITAYYSSVNYGKHVEAVDLTSEETQLRLAALLNRADVLIQNFKPADLEKFKLEPDRLMAAYPALIHCHLTGFKSDPDRVAYDVVLQAETGFMSMNGTQTSGPVKMPVALVDVLAAHQMKSAVLLALYRRQQTGKGAYIHATLEEAALAALTNQASNHLMTGAVPQRMGSMHPNIAPYGDLFTTTDGASVVLAIGSDRQFALFCSLIGTPELSTDPRFTTNPARVKNRSALIDALQGPISQQAASELLSECHRLKIPAGRVNNLAEVFTNPIAQKMVRDEMIDGELTLRMSSLGFTMTEA